MCQKNVDFIVLYKIVTVIRKMYIDLYDIFDRVCDKHLVMYFW